MKDCNRTKEKSPDNTIINQKPGSPEINQEMKNNNQIMDKKNNEPNCPNIIYIEEKNSNNNNEQIKVESKKIECMNTGDNDKPDFEKTEEIKRKELFLLFKIE